MQLASIGAVLLIVGWVQVSHSLYPAQQLPYIVSAGLGGIFLLGVSATCWLSADLRDEWRKLDRVEETFADVSQRLARLERPVPATNLDAALAPSEVDVRNGDGLRLPAREEGLRA